MPGFEESFSDFLDRREYDSAANALYSIVRIAYTAGWLAAGGKSPKPQKVVELHRPRHEIPPSNHPDSIETDISVDKEKE